MVFELPAQNLTCGAYLYGNPYRICQYADLNLYAIGNDPNGTYQWSGPNFLSSLQYPTISNVSLAAEGTYYVTFTDSQQSYYCNFDVEVDSCCFGSGTASSYLTGNISDILLSGIPIEKHVAADDLIIDIDFDDFAPEYQQDGYEIVLLNNISNQSITVQSGASLEIAWGNIHSCNDLVEYGITVGEDALLTLNYCYLRDGAYMIMAMENSGLSINRCHFHANDVSIYFPIPNDPESFYTIDPFKFNANEFDCENENVYGLGHKSYCGILAYNLEYLNIDPIDSCTFHDMMNGIVMWDSYLSVRNCTFEDIQTYGYVAKPTGNGIYSGKHLETGPGTLRQEGLGNGIGSTNTFTACKTGIHTANTTLETQKNRMEYVETGVLCETSDYQNNDIKDNYILATANGIHLYYNDLASNMNVSGNDINMDDPGGAFNNSAGIKIVEDLGDHSNKPTIHDNRIYVDDGYHGIYLNSISDYEVYDNWIYLRDPDVNFGGISIYNCYNNNIYCNLVFGMGDDLYNGSYIPRGITLASSTYNGIKCNSMSEVYCGISMEESCYGSEFKGNEFFEHTYGFRANPQGNLYHQVDNGNRWNDCYITEGARNENSFTNWKFECELDCPFEPDVWYASYQWFYISNEDPFECLDSFPDCILFSPESMGQLILNESDSLIALGLMQFEAFQEEMSWSNARYLYQKLTGHPGAELTQSFQSFYDSVSSSSAGLFQELDFQIRALLRTDAATACFIENIHLLYQSTADSLRLLDSLFRNADNPADSNLYLNAFLETLDHLRTYRAMKDELLLSYIDTRQNVIETLVAENESLPEGEVFESNEKTVNAIYLQSIAAGIDSLTFDQLSTLATIANQCPVSGGKDAVYKSRAMLSRYFDFYYDDVQLCLQDGIVKNKTVDNFENLPVSFAIAPNPAVSTVMISWTQTLDESCSFTLYNSLGMKSQEGYFSLQDGFFEIDLTSIPAGTYFLRLQPPKDSGNTFKIVVVK